MYILQNMIDIFSQKANISDGSSFNSPSLNVRIQICSLWFILCLYRTRTYIYISHCFHSYMCVLYVSIISSYTIFTSNSMPCHATPRNTIPSSMPYDAGGDTFLYYILLRISCQTLSNSYLTCSFSWHLICLSKLLKRNNFLFIKLHKNPTNNNDNNNNICALFFFLSTILPNMIFLLHVTSIYSHNTILIRSIKR